MLIGFTETDPAVQSWLAAFSGALARLGWTEGSNLGIEVRWTGYDPDRMKTFAKELVDLRPDAILSVTTPVTVALVRETQIIPIVLATVADPISSGLANKLMKKAKKLMKKAKKMMKKANKKEKGSNTKVDRRDASLPSPFST